jgi:hypothetical protein
MTGIRPHRAVSPVTKKAVILFIICLEINIK